MKKFLLFGLMLLGVPQVASAQPGVIDGTKVRHTDTKSNYIKNTDAEKNLLGVSANPDNVNYTNPSRTTTSGQVLEGSASFRVAYNAPACTINGDGCLSEAVFEINSLSDFVKSQMCEASFKYKRVTGVGGGGSNLWVKFYDASSNILFKQDLGYINLPETGTLSAYYPCADVEKIGVGVVTGSASIDDIYFGLQTNVGFASGVPITSFTPVITHISGAMTNATTTGWYSCSNKVATISTRTSFTGASGTFSGYRIGVPPGLTMASTVDGQSLGSSNMLDVGVAYYSGTVTYAGGFVSVFTNDVTAAPGKAAGGLVSNTSPFTGGTANSDNITATYSIPVTHCPGESVFYDRQGVDPRNFYWPTLEAACPKGTLEADGTNGTTDWRAMFPRGAGNQTVSGTTYTGGTVGTKYRDQFQGHRHSYTGNSNLLSFNAPVTLASGANSGGNPATALTITDPTTDGVNGTPRTGVETRPSYIAVRWCKVVDFATFITAFKRSVVYDTQVVAQKADGFNTIDFGTYTPTATGITNISATAAGVCQYMRMGNVVNVSCRLPSTCTAGSNTGSSMTVPLPIASNVSGTGTLNGVSNGAAGFEQGVVTENVDRALIVFRCNSTASLDGRRAVFQYSIQ